MTQQILLLMEATGIQDYVFGSNQLAQNIGASELVTQATTDWVYQELPQPHNVEQDPIHPDRWRITDRALVADGLAAEVVYAGGGNAMILFADDDRADAFARRLTQRILAAAPGLQVLLKRQSFNPHGQALAKLHHDLHRGLAKRKLDRPRSVPLMGLSVTAACIFTGAPAVALDEERRLISAEVSAKLSNEKAGKERLKRHLSGIKLAGYEFVYDFDMLGSKGEASYLAVVHADGNRMGERIKAIGAKFPHPEDNTNYVQALRRFSESVQTAASVALNRTVGMLLAPDNIERDDKGNQLLGGMVPIWGNQYLPFRPIVFGGDDVTFVAEGRLGLEIAARYLSEYASHRLADGDRVDGKLAEGFPAYARAGVAVVKTHYPFSRAYELADDLCQSAKAYIKERTNRGEPGVTAVDWHFAVAGLVLPLKDIREREYTAREGTLLMRPLRLNDPSQDWRSWRTFFDLTYEFQRQNGEWAGRRNKVKALRDALREGKDATQIFLRNIAAALPPIPGQPELKHTGWHRGVCGYFDVIEALDFYVPLHGGFRG